MARRSTLGATRDGGGERDARDPHQPDASRPPLPRYGPPLTPPADPRQEAPRQEAPREAQSPGERGTLTHTTPRFPTAPPRPAPSTGSLAGKTGAHSRPAPVALPLDALPEVRRAPETIPLGELAEPTEAPPPWDTSPWPSTSPQWHTSLPPSSAWVDDEREDVEYVDPIRPERWFHVPVALRWCVAIILAVFLGRVILYHGDWAAGALVAAVGAGALACVVCVTALLGMLGARRLRLGACALALLLALSSIVLASDGVQARAHLAQASFAARTSQWSDALAELGASGADPAWIAGQSADARLGWGAAATGDGSYALAVSEFASVLSAPGTSAAQRARAQAGEVAAYERWVAAGGSDLPYPTALDMLEQYAAQKTCDNACAAQVATAEARAYDEYGAYLIGQGDMADAVTVFEIVTSRFSTSAVAPAAHRAAASALATLAQQHENASCPSAVPDYQRLASIYSDTPQGAQAQTVLTTPVLMHSTIHGLPNPHATRVLLIPLASAQAGNDTPTYIVTADVVGSYTFVAVVPGTYVLGVDTPGWGRVLWSSPAAYVIVAPLCAQVLGAHTFP